MTGTYKIIVGGEDQTEKSALVANFGPFVSEASPTEIIGVDFSTVKVKLHDKVVTLQIWELSSESRFHLLLPEYCKLAKCGLIIFDLTRPDTLQHLEEWVRLFRTSNVEQKIPIILVGTNSDLKRAVSKEEALSHIKQLDLQGYVECSLKTGENVEDVFILIIQVTIGEVSRLKPDD